MANHTGKISRFYYPVPCADPQVVLVLYAYESFAGASGVALLSEQGEPVTFEQLEAAEHYCRWLNAREGSVPAQLPQRALHFLHQGIQKARYLEQRGQRFLVLSVPPVAQLVARTGGAS